VPQELSDRIVRNMITTKSLSDHLGKVSEEIVSKEVIRRVEREDGTRVHPRVRKAAATVNAKQLMIEPDLTNVEDE